MMDPLLPLCGKRLLTRSKYAPIYTPKCHRLKGHEGKCKEFPFLRELEKSHFRVAQKIKRDSIMTTGAAWKSDDAGPNRILRCVMLEDDLTLKRFGLNMAMLKPGIVAKLRDKAASYDDCVRVAIALTVKAYNMKSAPLASQKLATYFEATGFTLEPNSTFCEICRLPLDFRLFRNARRGKAEIETCHKDPRLHTPENVGFAHRECNIAQGPKTLDEFYSWIRGILQRAGRL